ncbi:hypothetical protein [Mitsuaria sp. 7]|uniref:hypothetical protein n=1 Tax=Mitsuaria sp. 7 TaxID=1658665 RepID=UPI0007DD5A6F|nr:hypothetical protein [Mitsuaria sp. 7]ANH66830.1 hypothetical protein ABE85_03270 [Mitsuaria sp. 7]
MLNGLSHVIAADPASTFLSDTRRSGTDGPGAHIGPGSADTSAIDRATQVDQANALFKKIFDDEEAWLDPQEQRSMIGAMAGVGLAISGFDGLGVRVRQAIADSSSPDYVPRPGARVLEIVYGPGRDGTLRIMATINDSVRVLNRHPPIGFGALDVEGVVEALSGALRRPRGERKTDLSPGDADDFGKSLRSAMRRVVEDDPAEFLRLARQGARVS